MNNYNTLFKNAGLTSVQTEIYEFLLNNGEYKASDIAKKIKRPRGVVYKGLDELYDLGLVEKKDKPNQVSLFKAEHPSRLESLFESQEKNIQKNRHTFSDVLPDLVSQFNLVSNKPGVRFYEGEKGIWRILKDTLSSKTEILTIADVEAVNKYLKNINAEYVKKRNRKGIKKRLLALNSEYAKNHFSNTGELTDVKLIDLQINPFSTSIQIYDNKISYITMTEENLYGTIMEDKHIYSMHKALFELTWGFN